MDVRRKEGEQEVSMSKMVVREAELQAIVGLRDEVEVLRKKLNELERDMRGRESATINKLKAGAVVEGALLALVTLEEGARRPAWKELYLSHFADEHGKEPSVVEAEIKAETEPATREVLQIGIKLKESR